MHYWVYVHTCKANGKRYVGIITASKPERRWQGGKGYQNNEHFYRAILKYGWTNFQHEVFEVESEEEMYRKEVELISFYHSNDPRYGYNHSSGGEKSASGCKHSEEVRRKHSEDNLKRWADPEYRKKLSESHKGKSVSEEARKHMSEAQKGKPHKPLSEEHKRRIAEAMKGKPFSEEHRKRVAESNRRRAQDPEYRKKRSEIQKNRPKIKIKLPDGTVIEMTKNLLARHYINKGKKFEYVS